MIDWSNSVAIDENQYLLDGDFLCMFTIDIYSNKNFWTWKIWNWYLATKQSKKQIFRDK